MTTESPRPKTVWPPVALPPIDIAPSPAEAPSPTDKPDDEVMPVAAVPVAAFVTSGLRPPAALPIDDDTVDRVIKAADARLPPYATEAAPDLTAPSTAESAGGAILNAAMIPGWPPSLPLAPPAIKASDQKTAPVTRSLAGSELSQENGASTDQPLAQKLRREAGMLLAILTYAAGLAKAALVIARELRGMGLERRQLSGKAETDGASKRRRFWLR